MVEITYHKEGDYFIPDLYLEKEEYEKDYQIGKYGHVFLIYLKFVEIGSGIYEKRIDTKTNESKR